MMDNDMSIPMEGIQIKRIIPDRTWEMIKPYILLRQLLEDNRAVITILTKKIDRENHGDQNLDSDAVIGKFFTDTSLDVFRHTISFLMS